MQPGEMEWHDAIHGHQTLDAKRWLGDFVVARNYGPAAYQLAVVVDDHDQSITHVVRGDDLIYSTYRQIALYAGARLELIPIACMSLWSSDRMASVSPNATETPVSRNFVNKTLHRRACWESWLVRCA
jgi:glutamyl/glutaminyl-tRNA synthetase